MIAVIALSLCWLLAGQDAEPPGGTCCGVGAARILLARLGTDVDVAELTRRRHSRDNVMSMLEVQALLADFGLTTTGERRPLAAVDRPMIAFLAHPCQAVGHFYVIEPSAGGFIVDDPRGRRTEVDEATLALTWDGRVLVPAPKGGEGVATAAWAAIAVGVTVLAWLGRRSERSRADQGRSP